MGEPSPGRFLEGLVLEAIAKASGLPASELRQAWMFSGNIGEIAASAGKRALRPFSFRASSLRRFHQCWEIPPMMSEALERLVQGGFEYKLDGARIQIHKSGDQVKIFTRQLQEVTERLPEIAEWTRLCRSARPFSREKRSPFVRMEGLGFFRPQCDGWPDQGGRSIRKEIPLTLHF
jgi:DNA ligase-1